MKLSLDYPDFKAYVSRQLDHFFPDSQSFPEKDYANVFDLAVDRTAYCFQHVTLAAYHRNGETHLNHLHSDQYAVFLWFLANTVWRETQNAAVANKLFCLNKALHGVSCMYDTNLPDIFLLLHAVGTVLGKAEYGDFFVAAHGCTVGAHHGKYPRIGKGVAMLTGSSIIGDCTVGSRVSLGINAVVYRKDIADDTVVYLGSDGQHGYKKTAKCWAQQLFNVVL